MKHTIQLLFCTKDKVTLIFLKMVIKEINSMFFPRLCQGYVCSQAYLASLRRQGHPVISSHLSAEMGQKELVNLVASERFFVLKGL